MQMTKKYFPKVGVLSFLGLITVIFSYVYFNNMYSKVILSLAVIFVAALVVDKVKDNPKCRMWEKIIFYILIGTLILVCAAVLKEGDPDMG